MSITLGWVLLNTAYLIYTVSGLFKDMLSLRVVWMMSTLFFIAHGLVDRLWPAVWWNVPVMIIHTYMIGSLLRQRRGIDLDDEAEAIRTLLFADLDRVSFNALWHCGVERHLNDGHVMIVQDRPVDELSLILHGEVEVLVDGKTPLRMGHFRLIGEISTLAGGTATATVSAHGELRMRVWKKVDLDACGAAHPRVEVALLRLMGQEAARKLN